MGTAFKHQHTNADEIQIVLEGTGTEWLGDKQIDMKPGTMVVIPRGTTHAGIVDTSGRLKFISIKSPPQDPTDVHRVP
jgi:mannose-6-phosphate isomerase-like protein (cupin superfamily)